MLLGAEPSELGQDDLEELADDEDEYFRLGDVDEQFRDYAALQLKGDHSNRRGLPLWCPGCQGVEVPSRPCTQPGMIAVAISYVLA